MIKVQHSQMSMIQLLTRNIDNIPENELTQNFFLSYLDFNVEITEASVSLLTHAKSCTSINVK